MSLFCSLQETLREGVKDWMSAILTSLTPFHESWHIFRILLSIILDILVIKKELNVNPIERLNLLIHYLEPDSRKPA